MRDPVDAARRELSSRVDAIHRLEQRARHYNQTGDDQRYWAARQLAHTMRQQLDPLLDMYGRLLSTGHHTTTERTHP